MRSIMKGIRLTSMASVGLRTIVSDSTLRKSGPRITAISAYQVDIPLTEGYRMGRSELMTSFDSTVVRVETDAGIEGWGEQCSYNRTYSAAYPEGTRSGIQAIAPALIGQDPTQIVKINHTMDKTLKGHPYVKSAIDIACWDIFGKMAELPVWHLLGGKFQESVPLFASSPNGSPDFVAGKIKQFQKEGFKKFQCKVGVGAEEDIEIIKAVAAVLRKDETVYFDANCSWSSKEALKVLHGIKDIKIPGLIFEQPCKSYQEMLHLRQKCPHPIIFDEPIVDVDDIIKISRDWSGDQVAIKLGRVGGLTKALRMINLCIHFGLPVRIEECFGWDMGCAAIFHLAHAVPEEFLAGAFDFSPYAVKNSVHNAAKCKDGRISAPMGPGLGVTPLLDILGEPCLKVE